VGIVLAWDILKTNVGSMERMVKHYFLPTTTWKSWGTMHKWVDQFAIEPKFLFTQNLGQFLKITTSLH